MSNKIVLDIETKNAFDDVGGQSHVRKLEASVVGVYSYRSDSYFCFEENEFDKLAAVVKGSELIVGFSIRRFDLPVLEKYFPFDVNAVPSLDILDDIEAALGRRISLNELAVANLGVGKTRHSLEAIDLYKEGRMEELKEYCLNDVKITRNIYELGKKQGYLWIPQRKTPVMTKLNFNWEPAQTLF